LPDSLQRQRTIRNGRSAREAIDKSSKEADPQLDARARLNAILLTFLKHYLLLDLVKVLMMHDPYFWGLVSSAPARPFPFTYLPLPSIPVILVRLYRETLSGLGVYAALSFVTPLNPIIFLGLSLAFPNASRALTRAPLDAPWLYSDPFGPLAGPSLDHGLIGCWSQWWHQLFRFGFTSTANFLLSLLPEHLAVRPSIRRTVTAVTAFSLSGLIHACGSYTQFAETTPHAHLVFFLLQPVGIMIQNQLARSINARYRFSRPIRRAANVMFAFWWLFFSGASIADDFARGGLWLTEPLPISPLRGLGLGAKGEGWWCWREPWFRYWDGGKYWERGLRVL
jgi:hypothetical protein